MYAVVFSLDVILEGLGRTFYILGLCKNVVCFPVYIFVITILKLGILAFMLYLLVVIGKGAHLSFNNPSIMFYIQIAFDSLVHLVVTFMMA